MKLDSASNWRRMVTIVAFYLLFAILCFQKSVRSCSWKDNPAPGCVQKTLGVILPWCWKNRGKPPLFTRCFILKPWFPQHLQPPNCSIPNEIQQQKYAWVSTVASSQILTKQNSPTKLNFLSVALVFFTQRQSQATLAHTSVFQERLGWLWLITQTIWDYHEKINMVHLQITHLE